MSLEMLVVILFVCFICWNVQRNLKKLGENETLRTIAKSEKARGIAAALIAKILK